MTDQEILSHVDHTLLKASASWEDITALCNEAVQYKTASVCIPPSYVKPVHETYGNTLTLCTVIGFPLGYSVSRVKAVETEQALADGAVEIDMVINIGDVKNRRFDRVLEEITALKQILGDRILKVIVETCYLTMDEKIRLCELVRNASADYIKTSTGFGTAGAVQEDIHLFKKHIGPQVKIKAAGGIRTRGDLESFLNAGCHRIGTSSAVALLRGSPGKVY
ncbi:MAG: deoxyribose-phosphate aldolase [Treponema sp.]|jgi:deoxyribose-phosphate aldolase|nr:deoxyribose-phosphate aldolase [Treponema sp.]